MRGSERISFTSWLLNFRMMSPLWIFALSAGPPSFTPATIAPEASFRPRLSAISGVTCWMRTPSQPRRGWPKSFSCATTALTMLAGIEKPMPIDPPDGE